MSGHRLPFDLYNAQNKAIPDPGDAGTIRVNADLCHVPLVSAAPETRTLPAPGQQNLHVLLYMKTDGGDITLTVTGGFDEAGTTSAVFSATGQYIEFVSVEQGSDLRWRVVGYDGVTGPVIDIDTVDVTTLKIGGTSVTATAAEINRAADTSGRLIAAGGTLAVTEALHDGKIIALDTAAGSVCTLPAATGSGSVFRFLVTVTATSNSHIIKVTGNDTMTGFVHNNDLDGTAVAFYKATSTDDTITLNRTTTGGVIGDEIECIDMLADLYFVKGAITCVAGNNIATPFSATV